ncbi:MAG: hypothetical protein D6768_15205 [Chloroflexi bacterium]|nr:MAG: hypothetical protein D6768_15205 [Chloroflexota bacterium]
MKRSWLVIVLSLAALLSACGAEAAAVNPLDIGNPERGREIFETGGGLITPSTKQGCTGCHSLDGSDRNSGPSLQGIARRAGERMPELSAVEYLHQSIVDPGAYLVDGYEDEMMKGLKVFLKEEDINDLIAFLLTQ